MLKAFFPAAAIALFLSGCAETAAPTAASPPTVARRAGGWQQFCEQAWNVPHASSLVAARGTDGWELVAMYNGVLCYKRPDARAPAGPPAGQIHVPLVRDPGF